MANSLTGNDSVSLFGTHELVTTVLVSFSFHALQFESLQLSDDLVSKMPKLIQNFCSPVFQPFQHFPLIQLYESTLNDRTTMKMMTVLNIQSGTIRKYDRIKIMYGSTNLVCGFFGNWYHQFEQVRGQRKL